MHTQELCILLANAPDKMGRLSVNMASPLNLKVMHQFIYLLRRYEILNSQTPQHVSQTCTRH